MITHSPLIDSSLADLPLVRRGKVRDVYAVDDAHLLIVATDRISAFDYVLGSGIPDKGRVLTQLSAFWFDKVADLVPHVRTDLVFGALAGQLSYDPDRFDDVDPAINELFGVG